MPEYKSKTTKNNVKYLHIFYLSNIKEDIENLNYQKSGTSKTDSRLALQTRALDAAVGRRFSNIAIILLFKY